jgi:hypothetical protein
MECDATSGGMLALEKWLRWSAGTPIPPRIALVLAAALKVIMFDKKTL